MGTVSSIAWKTALCFAASTTLAVLLGSVFPNHISLPPGKQTGDLVWLPLLSVIITVFALALSYRCARNFQVLDKPHLPEHSLLTRCRLYLGELAHWLSEIEFRHFLIAGIGALGVAATMAGAIIRNSRDLKSLTAVSIKIHALVAKQDLAHVLAVVSDFVPLLANAIAAMPILIIPVLSFVAMSVGYRLAEPNGSTNGILASAKRVSKTADVALEFLVWVVGPIGVCSAAWVAVANFKEHWDSIQPKLEGLVGSFILRQLLFALLMVTAAHLFARVGPKFLARIKEPLVIGLLTSSSEVALPSAMEAIKNLGVPGHIANFVLATGTNFNLDGSALYVALVVTSLSSNPHPVLMFLTVWMLSRFVAPVPRASIVVITVALSLLDSKVYEPAIVLLALDFGFDIIRTCMNMLANCVCASLVAKWEGFTFDEQS